MADELQLKGLNKGEEEVESIPKKVSKRQRSQGSNTTINPTATSKDKTISSQRLHNGDITSTSTETAIALNNVPDISDLEELDTNVKSMMRFSQNKLDKQQGRARICKMCGKEGQMITIMDHIEANHMTNISLPCDVCGKTSKSRSALKQHKRYSHSKSELSQPMK